MAIETVLSRQRDFSAGQVNAEARRRDDSKIVMAGLRTATNVRIGAAGAAMDRSSRVFDFAASGRPFWARPAAGIRHKIVLGNGTFTARDENNSVVTTLTGCPWNTAALPNLRITNAGPRVIVTGAGMQPQVMSWDGATWSRAGWAFLNPISDEPHMPFYRFADAGVTMLPSARIGAITVTFSDDVLTNDHVGVRFRYYDKQIKITSVTDARNAAAQVASKLPTSMSYTLTDVTGFSVGDIIEGSVTGTQAYVAEISGFDLHVVMLNNYVGFDQSDKLVGPDSYSAWQSSTGISPLAIELWDEQLFSDVRGWPQSCFYDKQRVGFCHFPQLGQAVFWGALGTWNDGKIGAGPDDAMLELLPENCVVQDVVGGNDEFVLTDNGIFYIPISASNPLKAGDVEFRRITPAGAADIAPTKAGIDRASDGGEAVLFVGQGGLKVNAIAPTGSLYVFYQVVEASTYHSDLFADGVVSITAGEVDSEQLGVVIYTVRPDGSLVVGRYDPAQQWVGWTPWQGVGAVRYVAADQNDLMFAVDYAVTAGTTSVIEKPIDSRGVDCIVAASDTATLASLAGLTGAVFVGPVYMGQFVIANDGSLTGWTGGTGSTVKVGFPFTTTIEPFLPTGGTGPDHRQGMRRRRVAQAMAVLEASAAEIEFLGRRWPAYLASDNPEAAPPMRDWVLRGGQLGRSFDPTVTLTRALPGRMRLIELAVRATI